MTFSIAAIDPETGKNGIAISSATIVVGAQCPFVGEHGAVSSQSFGSGRSYGQNAVEMLDRGISLQVACRALLDEQEGASYTQLHGIDRDGQQFVYTGADCIDWAGHTTGEECTAAGNMLDGEQVVEAMVETFESTDAAFEERLLTALEAGEEAGGDKRAGAESEEAFTHEEDEGALESAALLVYSPEPKLYHNLRIDCSTESISELHELYDVARELSEELPELADEYWGEGAYPEEILVNDVKF
jgi:uncharacterized Ntn-hydrolase superfamily protein